MQSIRHGLAQGQRLGWQGQAGQCVEVRRGRVEVEEILWVESRLLCVRQRLGPGSCYVLHSSGWVSVQAVSAAELSLPAPLVDCAAWRRLGRWLTGGGVGCVRGGWARGVAGGRMGAEVWMWPWWRVQSKRRSANPAGARRR